MIEGITRRFIEIGTYHLQVHMYDELTDAERGRMLDAVRSKPGVRLAFWERQGLGILHSQAGRTGVQIRSVPADLYRRDRQLRRYFQLEEGRFDLGADDSLLLGSVVAETLGVGVGDELKVLTVKRFGADRYIPRVTRFRVTGIFTTGYQDLDKTWVYIPYETGRRILSEESSRRFLAVKADDPFGKLDAVAEQVRSAVPADLLFFRVNTWFELEENQYRSFRTTRTLLVFIMILIVLVASVNVSSTMVLMVLEKSREIAILKSMGASPGLISTSYLMTGFVVGVAGALVGLSLGLLLSVNINEVIRGGEHLLSAARRVLSAVIEPIRPAGPSGTVRLLDPSFYLERIPIRIRPVETAAAAFLAVFLSTAASYLPARRAGRTRPLHVLRRI